MYLSLFPAEMKRLEEWIARQAVPVGHDYGLLSERGHPVTARPEPVCEHGMGMHER